MSQVSQEFHFIRREGSPEVHIELMTGQFYLGQRSVRGALPDEISVSQERQIDQNRC